VLVQSGAAAVLALGDLQYDSGSLSDFQASYDPSWGRVKPATRPALGNHEPGNASGYFDYFNGSGVASGPAGQRGKGYYSFDVGTWHLIALNSNCSKVPCSSGSAQERWLRADLAAHPTACTLAYWHHPRFSSGYDGNSTFMQTLWRDLYDADVEVALSGHSHDYERFAPQNAVGKLDPARGIRQFVVGTGGAFFTAIGSGKPNSQVRQNSTYGVLQLTLHPMSYDWTFTPEAGGKFTDSGTTPCHGLGAPTPLPPPQPPARPLLTVNPRTGVPDGKNSVTCTIAGGDGPDVLRGTPGDDVICGLGGDDRIRGLDGNDVILGGPGRDSIYGGKGGDLIYGNDGDDRVAGQSRGDRLIGGNGRDRLYGNSGNDRIRARDSRRRERVAGGAGYDRAWINPGDRPSSIERLRR
jgi:hypothetical protein